MNHANDTHITSNNSIIDMTNSNAIDDRHEHSSSHTSNSSTGCKAEIRDIFACLAAVDPTRAV